MYTFICDGKMGEVRKGDSDRPILVRWFLFLLLFFEVCITKHRIEYTNTHPYTLFYDGRVCESESECVSIFKSNRTKTFQCLFNVISLIFRYAIVTSIYIYIYLTQCGGVQKMCPIMLVLCVPIVWLLLYVYSSTLLSSLYWIMKFCRRIQCLKSLQLYQQIGMRTVSNFERMNKCLLMLLLLLLLLLMLLLHAAAICPIVAVCLLIPLFNTQCCSILRDQTRKLHVTMRKLQYKSIDSNYVALHFTDVDVCVRALMRINALLLKHISTISTHKIQNQTFSRHWFCFIGIQLLASVTHLFALTL